MRAAVFFVPLLACAHGLADPATTGVCLMDSSEAVSDAMDAAMFMWASIDRCEKAKEEIKCSVGILSTVQSLNGMLNVILKALNKCGDFNPTDYKCTEAGLALTKASAGVGATAANVAQHCEKPTTNAGTASSIANGNWPQQDPAQCIVDIKDSLKNLFKAVRALLATTDKCAEGSEHCAANVMSVLAAFSGFGGYISGAVGHCSLPDSVKGSVCGQASLQLVQDLEKIGQAGVEAHLHCGASAERLYSEIQTKKLGAKTGMASTTNLLLAAFVPVTAVASFVTGTRLFKSTHARECLSDHE